MAEQSNGFTKNLVLVVAILLIIVVGGVSYLYSTTQNQTMQTNSTMTTGQTMITPNNMTMSTNSNATTPNTATNTTNLTPMQQNATTQDYRVALRLGPPAQMISINQTLTAISGEVMVSGQISNVTSMNMTDRYQLEVHVYNITSGAVVTAQNVTIQIVNHATNQSLTVPVIMMYDVKAGPADTHFGNNVSLQPGSYTVIVNINGEKATFNLTVSNQA